MDVSFAESLMHGYRGGVKSEVSCYFTLHLGKSTVRTKHNNFLWYITSSFTSYFHGQLLSELAVFFHMKFLSSKNDEDIGKWKIKMFTE